MTRTRLLFEKFYHSLGMKLKLLNHRDQYRRCSQITGTKLSLNLETFKIKRMKFNWIPLNKVDDLEALCVGVQVNEYSSLKDSALYSWGELGAGPFFLRLGGLWLVSFTVLGVPVAAASFNPSRVPNQLIIQSNNIEFEECFESFCAYFFVCFRNLCDLCLLLELEPFSSSPWLSWEYIWQVLSLLIIGVLAWVK